MGSKDHFPLRTAIGPEVCRKILRDADFARVLSSIRCLPVARPTRIALVGDDHLIFTSHDDAISSLAEHGDVLVIQIDGHERSGATWSVTVSGIAIPATSDERPPMRLVREIDRGARLLALPLDLVTGERIH
jgi:hypothetical protein